MLQPLREQEQALRARAHQLFFQLLEESGVRLGPGSRHYDGRNALWNHFRSMGDLEGIKLCMRSFTHLRGAEKLVEPIEGLIQQLETVW